ncbi:MAG: hypothetical protein EXR71_14270 [Myxococcales bacterium]|nr:hypothetical protein [Myxococcales bacterium]
MPTLPPSHSTPGPERLTVRVSTGVQSQEGLSFGKLVWIEGSRLYVQVDATLRPLDLVTMRAALSPTPGTALLEGEVMRALPGAPNEPQGYLIRLKKVNEGDADRWQQFLRAKQAGGTLRELSDVRDYTGLPKSTVSGVGERDRLGAFGRTLGGAATTWTSDRPTEQGSGRAAMRDALRAAMKGDPQPNTAAADGAVPAVRSVSWDSHGGGTPQARSFGPSAPSGSPPGRVAPGGVSDARPPREISPGIAVEREDPGWLHSDIGGRSYLQVTWKGAAAFAHDANTQLVSGVLTLTSDGRPLPATPAIHVLLRYEALVIQCAGTAIRSLPLTATYRLDLSAPQVADIRRMAKPPSVAGPR